MTVVKEEMWLQSRLIGVVSDGGEAAPEKAVRCRSGVPAKGEFA